MAQVMKTDMRQTVTFMANFEKDTRVIIRDCIEEIEIATPWTFCHFLGTSQGTVYGYECTEWDTLVLGCRNKDLFMP